MLRMLLLTILALAGLCNGLGLGNGVGLGPRSSWRPAHVAAAPTQAVAWGLVAAGQWAVWQAGDGRDSELVYSRRSAGGWQPARPVLQRPEARDCQPSLAVGAGDETPWLAWVSRAGRTPDDSRLLISHWEGSHWSEPEAVPLGGATGVQEPSLAAAADGTLWLAWAAGDGVDDEIYAAHRDGQGWSVPRQVNTPDDDPALYDRQPRLAVGGDGRPWLAWTGHQAGDDDEIWVSRWTGQGWSPEEMVSTDDEALDVRPALALDAQGQPWIAWQGRLREDGRSHRRILATHWDAARARWTPEALASSPLAAAVEESEPALLPDATGAMRLAWVVTGGTGPLLATARWQAGRWTAPEVAAGQAPAGEAPALVAWNGTHVALWLAPAPGEVPLASVSLADGAGSPIPAVPETRAAGAVPIANRHLAFGDSITYGAYSGNPYPKQLEEKLDQRVVQSEMINAGEPGEATSGGSERITGQVGFYQPEYVLILEGTNDVTRAKLPAEVYDNLAAMIDNAQVTAGVQGVNVMLATIIPRTDGLNNVTANMNQQAVIPVAHHKGVPVCDLWSAFIANPYWQVLYEDDVHPTAAGLSLIANTFYGCLQATYPALAEERTPPQTWMEPLPATTECGQTQLARWNGTDNLSRVMDYDVQIQVGSQAWRDWLTGTRLTTAFFSTAGARYGETVGLRVRGRDVVGNQSDYSPPVYTAVADSVAPTEVHVDPLPPTRFTPFSAGWWAADACADIASYQVQYKVGAAGTWTDWLTTSAGSASFDPAGAQYGQTYHFQARARDAAGNWSAWSPAGEASTTLLVGLGGWAHNLRHQPVAAPHVSVDPTPLLVVPQAPGGFLAHLGAAGSYSLSVSQPDLYGSLPAMQNLAVEDDVVDLVFVLPPHDEAVTNGGFEAGSLAAWTTGGSAPPALSSQAHTGLAAARLAGTAGSSSLLQVITPRAGATALTLSLLVRLEQSGAPGSLQIVVTGGQLPAPVTLDLEVTATAWRHAWLDLAGAGTGPLTLSLVAPAGPAILVDEVSLGSVLPGGSFVHLPLVTRQD